MIFKIRITTGSDYFSLNDTFILEREVEALSGLRESSAKDMSIVAQECAAAMSAAECEIRHGKPTWPKHTKRTKAKKKTTKKNKGTKHV